MDLTAGNGGSATAGRERSGHVAGNLVIAKVREDSMQSALVGLHHRYGKMVPMSERDAIERTGDQPVTRTSLVTDLRRLGVQPGVVMLVHTKMSALGWICGGAQAVVEALLLAVGREGTLVLPAFSSSLSEPRYWKDPAVPESWWPAVRSESTAYHPDRTPTRGLGTVPELFRRWPGVQRSAHPQNSFAAFGPAAEHILHPHHPPYGFGKSSPLARLYAMDAHVLLLGVTHENNTSLHLAEHHADYPGKQTVMGGAPLSTGWVEFERLNGSSDDFHDIGEAFGDGEVRGRVGIGEARWMRQRAIVDFGAAWMAANRVGPAPSEDQSAQGNLPPV